MTTADAQAFNDILTAACVLASIAVSAAFIWWHR